MVPSERRERDKVGFPPRDDLRVVQFVLGGKTHSRRDPQYQKGKIKRGLLTNCQARVHPELCELCSIKRVRSSDVC